MPPLLDPAPEPAARALIVERSVRAAARAGNRLLSGHRARLEVSDPHLREAFAAVLGRMGVRIRSDTADQPPPAAEFVFVDSIDPHLRTEPAPRVEGSGASAAELPATVIAVDGDACSGRASDAASRIAWAARGMPVTARLARTLRANPGASGFRPWAEERERPILRIAVSLVLEPKTAAFAIALADAGCEVAVFSAASETVPEVARALAADGRIAVFAPTALGALLDPTVADPSADARAVDAAHAAAVLRWGPDLLIDDGSHLIRLAHTELPESLVALRGAAEETTSGVRPLHEMIAGGALTIPVIAVNDARTKTDFDNLIGTGQSCVFAIADCLEEAAGAAYRGQAGSRWTVIGYGPVGVGVARFAAALGAAVTVVERDPVRALAALHDGHEARDASEALPASDVVVSATGVWHTLDAAAVAALRPGTAVAVAGGIDDEVALDELRAVGWTSTPRTASVAEWCPPGGDRGVLLLANGGGVNYSAAEGNPIEVMDLSFATQLAALSRLLHDELTPGVHTLDAADERRVARIALEARDGAAAERAEGGTEGDGSGSANRGAESSSRRPSEAEPARPGGAAQPWTVHRYRHRPDEPLDSSE